MVEYVILVGTFEDTPYHVAVETDEFEGAPSDYFRPGCTDCKEVGRIQILGDIHLLPGFFDIR
jgi:hypothetical protein